MLQKQPPQGRTRANRGDFEVVGSRIPRRHDPRCQDGYDGYSGKIIGQSCNYVPEEEIRKAFASMVGTIEQVPPSFQRQSFRGNRCINGQEITFSRKSSPER